MFEYHATAINVVDGDTLDVRIDLGFKLQFTERIRLYGIDTPERNEPGYVDATVALRSLVMGSELIVRSVKPHDKYGRWLATIETPAVLDVAQAMIDAGLGVPYFGGAKQ
jgi:micrococcal nuclease